MERSKDGGSAQMPCRQTAMKPSGRNSRLAASKTLFTLMSGAVLARPAFADLATTDDEVLEEVIVVGLKASLTASMNVKRDATGVVDAITAEDIGKFPDTNLSEALQRITGIAIDRRNGEGATVTARGFGPQFNLVTLNGRQMPTADAYAGLGAGTVAPNGRSFNFANLAADGVSAVDVYKTGRADTSSGGIGATVDIRTVRPFDHDGTVMTFGAKGLVDPNVEAGDSITPALSGIFSYADDTNTWGVSLNASYQKRDSVAVGSTVLDWQIARWPGNASDVKAAHGVPLYVNNNDTPADAADDFVDATLVNAPAAGQLYGIPTDIRYYFADRTNERVNGQLTVQFAPIDSVTLTADYSYALSNLSEDRGEQTIWMLQNGFHSIEFDTNEAVATPVVLKEYTGAGKDFAFEQDHREQQNDLSSLGFNAVWDTDRVRVAFDFHDSHARSLPNDPLTGAGETAFDFAAKTPTTGNCSRPNICTNFWTQEFRFNEGLPIAIGTLYPTNTEAFANTNGNADYSFDESSLGSQVLRTDYVEQRTDLQQARLDGAIEFDQGRLQFGFENRELKSHFDGSAGYMSLGDWNVSDAGQVPTMVELLHSFSIADVFHDFSAQGMANSSWKGNANTLAQWALTPTARGGGGYGDWDEDSIPDGQLTRNPVHRRDNIVSESTQAVYVQFVWHRTLGSMPSNLRAGLRGEQTHSVSTANILIPDALVWLDGKSFRPRLSSERQAYSEKNDYQHVLPSIDFDLGLTDTIKARASWSKTIAQPDYALLVAGANLGGASGSTLNGFQASAFAQNPRLVPIESENLDLSLEWYFADNAYLSATYWSKHVDNYFGTGVFDESLFGIRDETAGPRARAAFSELQRRGLSTDDAALFTMIAMTEHSGGFTDSNGVFWPGGAAAYDGTSAQQAAFAAAFDILPAPDDPDYVFGVSRPINNRPEDIHGWEFGSQYFLGNSGFGAIANYTRVSGGTSYDDLGEPNVDQYPLSGLSDSANLILIYDKHAVTVRVAYNWRDQFIQSGAGGNPIYIEAYDQIDMEVGYNFSDHLSASFDAINLTGENSRSHGRSVKQMWSLEDQEPRYAFGVRYKL
ncbi:MAG: TonB-dependent receptor [Povalibacter sp.]